MLFLEVLKKDKGKGITSSTYISNQYNRPAKIFMLSKNKRLIRRVEETKKEKEIGQRLYLIMTVLHMKALHLEIVGL